jgi:hypothetical protein
LKATVTMRALRTRAAFYTQQYWFNQQEYITLSDLITIDWEFCITVYAGRIQFNVRWYRRSSGDNGSRLEPYDTDGWITYLNGADAFAMTTLPDCTRIWLKISCRLSARTHVLGGHAEVLLFLRRSDPYFTDHPFWDEISAGWNFDTP